MISVRLTGRWDDLKDIENPELLKAHLCDVSGVEELAPKIEHPQQDHSSVIYGPDKSVLQYGPPCYSLEDYEELCQAYAPMGLEGSFLICGIDTAANNYPTPFDVAVDKNGEPGTISVTPNMSAFDILQAVVAWADSQFDGFPHHCYAEGLDVDTEKKILHFSMGS